MTEIISTDNKEIARKIYFLWLFLIDNFMNILALCFNSPNS
ncbi:putative membrane protein [Serratia plymuthica A30]|nr:putative membrane protein [Serratia plymuthica A30]